VTEIAKMSAPLESTDAKNKLEDLSGIKIGPGENPYDALIKACNDDPVSESEVTIPRERERERGIHGIDCVTRGGSFIAGRG
jgi:hypothetical protein